MMSQNVMIPLSLLGRTIELLEDLGYPSDNLLYYGYSKILWELKVKMKKIELRDAYAKIITAGNEDDRDEARMQYLLQKRFLREDEGEPF